MLSGIFGDFMQAVGASERIFQLIDRVPEIPTSGLDFLFCYLYLYFYLYFNFNFRFVLNFI